MADVVKKIDPVLRKVQMLRNQSIAQHVVGEKPGPQVVSELKKGEVAELPQGVAESLVRAKAAQFCSKADAEAFAEAEESRLAAGQFINDHERNAWLVSQGIRLAPTAAG